MFDAAQGDSARVSPTPLRNCRPFVALIVLPARIDELALFSVHVEFRLRQSSEARHWDAYIVLHAFGYPTAADPPVGSDDRVASSSR